jgi:extracellular factor (EF) 3-hydroxypalmitic acid methyl ester biosynthesis protein
VKSKQNPRFGLKNGDPERTRGVHSAFSLDCSAENLRIVNPSTSDQTRLRDMHADTVIQDGMVVFKTSQGLDLQATLLKLTRFQAAFEVCGPVVLRTSEVLQEFKIFVHERPVYCGKSVISSLVNTGTAVICEAKLEDAWLDIEALASLDGKSICGGFKDFLQQWRRIYRIIPEYKAVLVDMQSFLSDMRIWLEQVELGVRSAPAGDRIHLERNLAEELEPDTTSALGQLFEKFEFITDRVEREVPEQRNAHSAFAKRLLHPLLLSSPFLYRTFHKPLGYAGDYEMVNMICRSPFEGSTLFAKIVNCWFLRQPPAQAHRNRIQFLADCFTKTSLAAARQGRPARIVSVGCGPAVEVQRFIAETELANQAQITLIDFNEETIVHTRSVLADIQRAHNSRTTLHLLRKSVNQILKEAGRSIPRTGENTYDFVYCAGLFDYLPDQICRRLATILYEWVAPGGLFVCTNVDRSNPRRLTMEYIMDWHLIYRNGTELTALQPPSANGDSGTITADVTGVNVHFALRKPERA